MKNFIIIMILSLHFSECQVPAGSFRMMSASLPAESETIGSSRVYGEHCRFYNSITGYAFPQMDFAVKDALSKVPGAKGLKDASIAEKYSPVFSYYCYEVDGLPVK